MPFSTTSDAITAIYNDVLMGTASSVWRTFKVGYKFDRFLDLLLLQYWMTPRIRPPADSR